EELPGGANQGRRAAGDQPQYAAQEDRGIRPGVGRRGRLTAGRPVSREVGHHSVLKSSAENSGSAVDRLRRFFRERQIAGPGRTRRRTQLFARRREIREGKT